MTRKSLHSALILLSLVNFCFTSCKEEIVIRTPSSKLLGYQGQKCSEASLLIFLDGEYNRLWQSGDSLGLISGLDIPDARIQPALMGQPKNMELARKLGLDRCFCLDFDPLYPMAKAVERLELNPHVEAYQYNNIRRAAPVGEVRAAPKSTESQWNLEMIRLSEARSLCTADPQLVVAVVDGPVKWDHKELAENMWVNEAEANGLPGVDDDDNGYVDDVYGYNFAQNKGEIDWSAPDEIGHATHVAGIVTSIAAGVKLMSAQIF